MYQEFNVSSIFSATTFSKDGSGASSRICATYGSAASALWMTLKDSSFPNALKEKKTAQLSFPLFSFSALAREHFPS
jgi:hypothetical protein